MKKFILQVCLAALLALPALPCLALGRSQFLYRIDSRPPEVVFAEGFTAPGANLDLMNHYSWLFARGHGESSGFIDLVGDEESAISLMSMARSTYSGYVYRIQVDQHFYSVNSSLRDLLQRMRAAGANWSVTFDVEDLVDRFDSHEQYVTDQSITGDMIISASSFTYTAGPSFTAPPQIDMTQTWDNEDFVQRDPSYTNLSPYPIAWSAPDTSSAPSSCSNPAPQASSSDNNEGAAGPDCDGDRLAVVGAFGVIAVGMLPVCLPHMKRSIDAAHCAKLPVVNISRRSRALRVLVADLELQPSGGGQGRDEL